MDAAFLQFSPLSLVRTDLEGFLSALQHHELKIEQQAFSILIGNRVSSFFIELNEQEPLHNFHTSNVPSETWVPSPVQPSVSVIPSHLLIFCSQLILAHWSQTITSIHQDLSLDHSSDLIYQFTPRPKLSDTYPRENAAPRLSSLFFCSSLSAQTVSSGYRLSGISEVMEVTSSSKGG